jgi:Na+-driven multidrug efflux pump
LAFYAFGGVYLTSVIATGAAKVGMYIELVIIVVYCAYMLAAHAYGVSLPVFWLTEPLYFSTMAFLSWLYLRSGHWRRYLQPKSE